MLELKNVTKKFGSNSAVSGVNIKIMPGEIFSLVGPNGSGKTTIVKMIAGLLHPTSGSISINDINVENDPIHAKSMIGYVPDDPVVWPSMTGEEFLRFVGALYGVEENKCKERISELISIFHLEGMEKGYFEDYSRGNKQKFTIISALIHQPKLLLVDEPISGLDPMSSNIVQKEFLGFAENGGSILIVTHALHVAENISDKIGLLRDGKLIVSGTIDELRSLVPLGSSTSFEEIYMALTRV